MSFCFMQINKTSMNLLKIWNRSVSLTTRRSNKKSLTLENMHQGIKDMEIPLKSPILLRAKALEEELKTGASKSFKRVIEANLADCHAMGQKPVTFIRQVLTLVLNPELAKETCFPEDVKERARIILSGCRQGSVGSYSDCSGIDIIRRHCAEYIERRDGIHSNWQNIILTNGSSAAIRSILKLLAWKVGGKVPGVMIPTPQIPMYASYFQEFHIHPIRYLLDESKNWGLDLKELNSVLNESRKFCTPRALIVVNPGNPTGHVLNLQNMQELITFTYNNNIFLLADEVYQENIYDEASNFHSFKKAMIEMGPPYSEVELASFMSVSNGFAGESGLRGGYVEIVNMDPGVYDKYLRSLCTILCPAVLGQAAVDCLVNPPREEEQSFMKFNKEKSVIMDSLRRKSELCVETFNSVDGVTCTPIQGSLYGFPQIHLPEKALEAAKYDHQIPDVFYASQLLEETGICVVPGSYFGQKAGTWHFRTTILPPENEFVEMLKAFKLFHQKFLEKYS